MARRGLRLQAVDAQARGAGLGGGHVEPRYRDVMARSYDPFRCLLSGPIPGATSSSRSTTRRPRGRPRAALRGAIRYGPLAPGTRLPSTRTLAADLGLARGTVAAAYEQLAAEGCLNARAGAGTVVAAGAETRRETRRPAARAPAAVRPARREPRRRQLPARRVGRGAAPGAGEAPDSALRLGDPRGPTELRRRSPHTWAAPAASWPPRSGSSSAADTSRPCRCSPAALAGRASRDGGPVPGVPPRRGPRGRLRGAALPVDEGARGSAPSMARRRRRVTPAHQFAARRDARTRAPRRARRWARASTRGRGRLRRRVPLRPPAGRRVAGLAPEHVVYAGTASKTLAPALRLAWMVLPEPLSSRRRGQAAGRLGEPRDRPARARAADRDRRARPPPATDARPLPPAPGRPRRDARGARAGRTRARHRRRVARRARAAAGRAAQAEVFAAARERSLAVTGLDAFWHEPAERRTLLQAGYATPPSHAFAGAIDALADVMRAAACRGS